MRREGLPGAKSFDFQWIWVNDLPFIRILRKYMNDKCFRLLQTTGRKYTHLAKEIKVSLPRLIEMFADPSCFTSKEAATALGKTPTAVRNDIKYLIRAGYVSTVRKGLYAFDPGKTGRAADRYVLASKLAAPSLLSYHTALELHGVAQSALWNVVYVGTPGRFEGFEYGESTFKPVFVPTPLMDLGAEPMTHGGVTIHVACRELAILQCADRLAYAGGFEELLKSIEGFAYLNWTRLTSLLAVYRKAALYRKTGFIVEQFADRWKPPADLFARLHAKKGKGLTYFGAAPRQGGELLSRWQLILPKDWKAVLEIG